MSGPRVSDLQIIGRGLRRPEDVAVRANGQVFASDGNACISEVLPDGSLRPVGNPQHEPNGINFTQDGQSLIVADFGAHQLQRCDLKTGEVEVLCDTVAGRALTRPNYPIILRDGTVYCTSSTASDVIQCIVRGIDDGYVFRVTPDGHADIVADRLRLPNGLAVDRDERYLFVVQTSANDVVRFPILSDRRLGAQEPYGPPLGIRTEWDEDGVHAAWGDNAIHEYTTISPQLLTRWGLPDGCAFDSEGNLWVTLAARNAVVAITPDQEVVTIVEDGEGKMLRGTSNISFGGPDLRDVYFGSAGGADYIVKGRSSVPGQLMTGQDVPV